MQNGKIVEFIRGYSDEHLAKFSDPRYFIEFLCEAIHTEFPGDVEKKENGKSVPTINIDSSKMCTIAEAMEMMGTKDRRRVDVPLKAGKIKRAQKVGRVLYLDRESVQEYIDYHKEYPGVHKSRNLIPTRKLPPQNDPDAIFNDDDDY